MKKSFFYLTVFLFITSIGYSQTNATSSGSGADWTISSGCYLSNPSRIFIDGDRYLGGSILLESNTGGTGNGNIILNAISGKILFKNSTTTNLTMLPNGNLGIGTTNPMAKLQILATNDATGFLLEHSSTVDWGYAFAVKVNRNYTKAFTILTNDNEVFGIYGNGDVKTKKIYAESVEVRPDVWADYVFDEDYILMNLIDVSKYIEINKHLPNVPSEDVIKKSGYDLNEMDVILLQKIEELTLYIIKQQQEIEKLKALNNND